MELKSSSPVVSEFVKDHQRMTRGLVDLLQIVRQGDLRAAVAAADKLDRESGPHIEFEEKVLYGEVGRMRGLRLEAQLRCEHDSIRNGLVRLSYLNEKDVDDPRVRAELVQTFETAIRHAESCGTLISHLESLSPERQQAAFEQLEAFRRAGRRWTELDNRP